jgi:hypothetical protein
MGFGKMITRIIIGPIDGAFTCKRITCLSWSPDDKVRIAAEPTIRSYFVEYWKNDTVTYLALPTVVSLTGLHFFPEGTTRKKSVGVEIPLSPNGTTKDVAEKFG